MRFNDDVNSLNYLSIIIITWHSVILSCVMLDSVTRWSLLWFFFKFLCVSIISVISINSIYCYYRVPTGQGKLEKVTEFVWSGKG